MDYTHYYYQCRDFSNREWQQVTTACAKILAHPDCPPVQYEHDDDKPAVSDPAESLIHFNGVGDDGHETFVVARDGHTNGRPSFWGDNGPRAFDFCKTAKKPYDLAVVACLCAIQRFAPNVLRVRSDGDPDEWQDGLE